MEECPAQSCRTAPCCRCQSLRGKVDRFATFRVRWVPCTRWCRISRAVRSAPLVHLDPDLQSLSVPRLAGWQPSFGQVGAAQGHLAKQGVGQRGPVPFLRLVPPCRGHRRPVAVCAEAPDIHSLFGWLQIGAVLNPGAPDCPKRNPWLRDHPHVAFANIGKGNTIYVGAKSLLGGKRPGSGVFAHWTDRLRLAAPGHSRSVWRLPDWMDPSTSGLKLTYHTDASRWFRRGGSLHLRPSARDRNL